MSSLRTRDVLEIGAGVLLLFVSGLVIAATTDPFSASPQPPTTPSTPDQFISGLPKIPFAEELGTPPPPPPPTPIAPASSYPLHEEITATVFWVGEPASEENGWVANTMSAWDTAWQEHFGGFDDPDQRNGFHPAGFTPKENPFYVALPYTEYAGHQLKENATKIYWYEPVEAGTSLLKNRWVKVIANGKPSYGQWEDVGPYETDDVDYVFGVRAPKGSIGIDVSPAIREYLGVGGKFTVSWQFVDAAEVPAGPWKEIVTTSGISW